MSDKRVGQPEHTHNHRRTGKPQRHGQYNTVRGLTAETMLDMPPITNGVVSKIFYCHNVKPPSYDGVVTFPSFSRLCS